MFGVFSVINA